jgi:hypothetical protein
MKIKKFESNKSEYNFNFGQHGHCFVLARYKTGWKSFPGSFFMSFENDEFVPCMVSGINTAYNHYDIRIIDQTGTYDINSFEILEGSDKGFEEMIRLYSSKKNYNL